MKYILIFFVFLFFKVGTGFSQENPSKDPIQFPDYAYLYPKLPDSQTYGTPATPEDGQAVFEVLRQFGNAFGVIVKGAENISKYFTWLFSRDTANAGSSSEMSNSKFISLRYVGKDVAIYHGMTISQRGQSRRGTGDRRNHVTFVIANKNDKWLITHQMIMDERD